jgi:hypothetical protein
LLPKVVFHVYHHPDLTGSFEALGGRVDSTIAIFEVKICVREFKGWLERMGSSFWRREE